MLTRIYHRLRYGHRYLPIRIRKRSTRGWASFGSETEICAACKK